MNKIKIEIKWALIFMIMTLVWMMLEKAAGLHSTHIDKHMIYTNFIAIPAIAVYVFALLDKRKNYYNGVMSYKQGLISGLILTLFVTILSPLTQYITSVFITPEYFPNAIRYAADSGHLTQKAAEEYFSLNNYLLQTIMMTPVMGIFTSIIVAIFTRKKAKA